MSNLLTRLNHHFRFNTPLNTICDAAQLERRFILNASPLPAAALRIANATTGIV